MFLRAQELFKNTIDRSYAILSQIARRLHTGNRLQLTAQFVQQIFALWRRPLDQQTDLEIFYKLTPFFQHLYTAPLEDPAQSVQEFFHKLPPELKTQMPTYESFLLKLYEVENLLIQAFDLDRNKLPKLLPEDVQLPRSDKAA